MDRVTGLKESIENIEHFAKVFQLSDSALDEGCHSVHFDRANMVEAGSHTGPYSMTGAGATNKRDAIQRGKDLTDKRRITT